MNRATAKGVGALHSWASRNHVDFDIPVAIGVSGGADSLALMICAAKSRFTDITVVTVDHGIQESSAVQAQKVKDQAETLGLRCVVEKVTNPCTEGSGNMEALAREGRYELFAKYPVVLVAHTINDQAETMLLGLGRGSGSRSIHGMREFRDRHIGRPFLSLTRKDTQDICEGSHLSVWNDPHNDHTEFRRVHVRKDVMPTLIDVFGDGILKNFGRTATQLQEDVDALDEWAVMATPSGVTRSYLPNMGEIPVAVKKRVMKNWLDSIMASQNPVNSSLIETAVSLENGKSIEFGASLAVKKASDGWRVVQR